jgi:Ca2+-transporting ATPase
MARPLDQERSTPPTVVSSNDGASLFVPPSPTLSTQSSVHFATSLSLRDNKPDERNGYSSLHLLSSPMDKLSAHHRKSSNATFASSHEGHSSLDETEPDHASGDYGMVHLHPVRSDPTSTIPSPTHTHIDTASDPTSTMPSPTHTHVDTASVLSRSQHAKSDIFSNVRWTIEGLLATLQAWYVLSPPRPSNLNHTHHSALDCLTAINVLQLIIRQFS